MTDLGTAPTQATPAGPLAPTASTPVGDVRTLRQVSRAEQERRSADARVERHAHAERLKLHLREERAAAKRRAHQARMQDKHERAAARRARRAAGWLRIRTAAPAVAEWALFTVPILMPMAVAWVGQIQFAMRVMGWPLPAAGVFAAGFELSTAYVARLDWAARAAGDTSLLFRAATWGFAMGAAVMNYWHAAGVGFTPTGAAVSYGLMSLTGVILWELLSTYRHRTRLREAGKLPAARPRFGLARRVHFRQITGIARLLAIRDGYPTTELAWHAAITAVEVFGSARQARTAIRLGRPVPPSQPARPLGHGEPAPPVGAAGDPGPGQGTIGAADPLDAPQDARRDDQTRRDRTHDHDVWPDHEPQPDRDTTSDHDNGRLDSDAHDETTPTGADAITTPVRDSAPRRQTPRPTRTPPPQIVSSVPDSPRDTATAHRERATRMGGDARGGPPAAREQDQAAAATPVEPGQATRVSGSLGARMLAYARQQTANGGTVTGADLDRMFGTNNYGSRVLRRLAEQPSQSSAGADGQEAATGVSGAGQPHRGVA